MAKLPGRFTDNGGFYVTATDGENSLVNLVLSPISGTKLPGAYAPDGSLYVTATDGNGNLIGQGGGVFSVSFGLYSIIGKDVTFV